MDEAAQIALFNCSSPAKGVKVDPPCCLPSTKDQRASGATEPSTCINMLVPRMGPAGIEKQVGLTPDPLFRARLKVGQGGPVPFKRARLEAAVEPALVKLPAANKPGPVPSSNTSSAKTDPSTPPLTPDQVDPFRLATRLAWNPPAVVNKPPA